MKTLKLFKQYTGLFETLIYKPPGKTLDKFMNFIAQSSKVAYNASTVVLNFKQA